MPLLLNQEEMRERLGLSKVTFIALREEGMPYIKISDRLLRFDPDEVMEWLRKRSEEKQKEVI